MYIYGLHAVTALLKNSKAKTSKTSKIMGVFLHIERKDHRLMEIGRLAKANGVTVNMLSTKELDGLADGGKHQGAVAAVEGNSGESPNNKENFESFIESIAERAFLLVLDGVQDPHNLGACLRTANAAGVHAVIVPKDNAVGLTSVVHKVASGAAISTPFFQVTNLARTLDFLKRKNIWIYGTSEESTKSIYEVKLQLPIAIVMGAEGTGLRRLTKESCDFLVSIPMLGDVPSLNVSVATGVCLFEARRQVDYCK